MDVTLVVTRRLSKDQLQKAQEFFFKRVKLAHKRQFDILLRGNGGPLVNSTGATGGAGWAKSKDLPSPRKG